MQPTLKPGDFIFSSRMSYGMQVPFSKTKLGASAPERGDLVVFTYPNQPTVSYVKRVVAIPGDRVQLKKNHLIINDVAYAYTKVEGDDIDNPNAELFDIYLEKSADEERKVIFQKQSDQKDFGPVVVPPGEIFLLGDNRDASDDSRYWGSVPVDQVAGRVFLIWLSLDWQKRWGGERYPSVRWQRIFSSPR
jgi:signal peptidase I